MPSNKAKSMRGREGRDGEIERVGWRPRRLEEGQLGHH